MFPPTPEKLVEIIDGEEGTCEVVSHMDAIDPSCFGWYTWVAVEIVDFLFDGGELVDSVDDFHGAWDFFGEIFNVIDQFGFGGNGVEQIDGVGTGRPI